MSTYPASSSPIVFHPQCLKFVVDYKFGYVLPPPELDFLMDNFEIFEWSSDLAASNPLNQNFSWGSCVQCTVSFNTLYIVVTFLHCTSLLSITLIIKTEGNLMYWTWTFTFHFWRRWKTQAMKLESTFILTETYELIPFRYYWGHCTFI